MWPIANTCETDLKAPLLATLSYLALIHFNSYPWLTLNDSAGRLIDILDCHGMTPFNQIAIIR